MKCPNCGFVLPEKADSAFSRFWRIPDKKSARRAVKAGFWAYIYIFATDLVIGILSIVTHHKVGGFDAWILVDGCCFAFIAWRLWKNSPAWAVIGVIFLGFEIVVKLQHPFNAGSVIILLLFLLALNSARGAFIFDKMQCQEARPTRATGATPAPSEPQDKSR